jgi:hypothetical protein
MIRSALHRSKRRAGARSLRDLRSATTQAYEDLIRVLERMPRKEHSPAVLEAAVKRYMNTLARYRSALVTVATHCKHGDSFEATRPETTYRLVGAGPRKAGVLSTDR